jgi:TPR repeat protein
MPVPGPRQRLASRISRPLLAAAAGLLVLCSLSPRPGFGADLGALRAAWQAGEHAAVALGLTPLAESGDPRAQLLLGHLRETGRSGTQDYAAALYWYRLAADQGIPEAQYALGLMHELGYGTPVDAGEAEYWYARAVGHGLCPGEMDIEAYWYAAAPWPPSLD